MLQTVRLCWSEMFLPPVSGQLVFLRSKRRIRYWSSEPDLRASVRCSVSCWRIRNVSSSVKKTKAVSALSMSTIRKSLLYHPKLVQIMSVPTVTMAEQMSFSKLQEPNPRFALHGNVQDQMRSWRSLLFMTRLRHCRCRICTARTSRSRPAV